MLLALLRGATLVVAASLLTTHGAAGLASAYVLMGVVTTAVQVPFMYFLLRKQAAVWAVPRAILEQA
jgi:ABC-type Fe3+-siderophore transport system permease subunit